MATFCFILQVSRKEGIYFLTGKIFVLFFRRGRVDAHDASTKTYKQGIYFKLNSGIPKFGAPDDL